MELSLVDLVTRSPAEKGNVFERANALARFKTGDDVFYLLTLGAALLVLLLLGGVIGSLIWGALPAFQAFGFNFLVDTNWDPVNDIYGAGTAIYGTLVTSAIALIIAIPVGLGIAIFLSELCAPRLRQPIGIAIELLAGIPSIIYGIWGFFILKPLLQAYIEPAIIKVTGPIPALPISDATIRTSLFEVNSAGAISRSAVPYRCPGCRRPCAPGRIASPHGGEPGSP